MPSASEECCIIANAQACVAAKILQALEVTVMRVLGVGLHSYGFMDRAFGPLIALIASQLLVT
jgi:hypothetical protein